MGSYDPSFLGRAVWIGSYDPTVVMARVRDPSRLPRRRGERRHWITSVRMLDHSASRTSGVPQRLLRWPAVRRSEEHTSELQSLMRISYAVFCLKKKKITETLS